MARMNFPLCSFVSFVVSHGYFLTSKLIAAPAATRCPAAGDCRRIIPAAYSAHCFIAAHNTHLAQRKAAFDQRNVCVCQWFSDKAGHHIALAIIGGGNQQAYFW